MRPGLAFITNQLPYPPRSGGVIKSWRLLSHLAAHFQITVVTPFKGQDATHVGALKAALPAVEVLGIPVQRPRTAGNFLRSLCCAPTLNVFRNQNAQLRQLANDAVQKADLVVVDHLEMFPYARAAKNVPVVLHQHNAEHVMWRRGHEVGRNLGERLVMRLEAWRVLRFEVAACQRADLVFAAPNDQQALVQAGVPAGKFRTTYHLGDDSGLNAPAIQFHETGKRLLYVGTLSWPANADGLHWFLENVWPLLKKEHADLVLDIVGSGAGDSLRTAVSALADVHLHGFVEDLEPFYRRSRVFIAPLRFGSGTKVKVITAMYRGIPCATTPVGAEGLPLVHGREAMVADEAMAMAESVLDLLNDQAVWEHMRDASRQLATEQLDWGSMLERHAADLLGLTKPQRA